MGREVDNLFCGAVILCKGNVVAAALQRGPVRTLGFIVIGQLVAVRVREFRGKVNGAASVCIALYRLSCGYAGGALRQGVLARLLLAAHLNE